MNPEIRAKCIYISRKVFHEPLGEFARKIMQSPSFLTILPNNVLSLDKIDEKLEKWKYRSMDEWHSEIIGFLSAISHECDKNLSLVFDTLIQMIDEEVNGFTEVKEEEEVVNDIQYALNHYVPNSKFEFYHDRKPPLLPQNITKISENRPDFTLDSINSLKDRISSIQSTHQLSKIGKIIISSSANESGIVEIKGGISVTFESLSPYTLQIIQNYINKISKEEES